MSIKFLIFLPILVAFIYTLPIPQQSIPPIESVDLSPSGTCYSVGQNVTASWMSEPGVSDFPDSTNTNREKETIDDFAVVITVKNIIEITHHDNIVRFYGITQDNIKIPVDQVYHNSDQSNKIDSAPIEDFNSIEMRFQKLRVVISEEIHE
ncbi:18366_t:CDS:2, partial [Gigaspora rosea]